MGIDLHLKCPVCGDNIEVGEIYNTECDNCNSEIVDLNTERLGIIDKNEFTNRDIRILDDKVRAMEYEVNKFKKIIEEFENKITLIEHTLITKNNQINQLYGILKEEFKTSVIS